MHLTIFKTLWIIFSFIGDVHVLAFSMYNMHQNLEINIYIMYVYKELPNLSNYSFNLSMCICVFTLLALLLPHGLFVLVPILSCTYYILLRFLVFSPVKTPDIYHNFMPFIFWYFENVSPYTLLQCLRMSLDAMTFWLRYSMILDCLILFNSCYYL